MSLADPTIMVDPVLTSALIFVFFYFLKRLNGQDRQLAYIRGRIDGKLRKDEEVKI